MSVRWLAAAAAAGNRVFAANFKRNNFVRPFNSRRLLRQRLPRRNTYFPPGDSPVPAQGKPWENFSTRAAPAAADYNRVSVTRAEHSRALNSGLRGRGKEGEERRIFPRDTLAGGRTFPAV